VLPALVPELEEAYGPDIKWGVWLEGEEHRARQALERAGLVLDSAPTVQGAAMADIVGLDAPAGAEPVDPAVVAEVNEAAYGLAPGAFGSSIGGLPTGELRAYGVRHAGVVASVAASIAHDDDAHVTFVATRPGSRRLGLGSRALRAALQHARDHGCTTTTLEASKEGAPVYRALGYRDLGEVVLYERRPRRAHAGAGPGYPAPRGLRHRRSPPGTAARRGRGDR
jgi:ribosomal protein S18 acetylase RimI-like enzyme